MARASEMLKSGLEVLAVCNLKKDAGAETSQAFTPQCHYMTLLLRGSGQIVMDGAEIPETRPLVWFLPAGTKCVERMRGPAESWYTGFNWPSLGVERHGVNEILFQVRNVSLRVPRWKVADAHAATRAVKLFSQLKMTFDRHDFSGAVHSSRLLMELFGVFVDLSAEGIETVGHRALARFQQLVQTHACDEITIEDLAAKAGASADHLRGLFEERFNVRPLEYRTALRLARARDLLISSDMNVKEAARRTGFADPLYFSRVFRKHYGMSPRELIRKYRLPT